MTKRTKPQVIDQDGNIQPIHLAMTEQAEPIDEPKEYSKEQAVAILESMRRPSDGYYNATELFKGLNSTFGEWHRSFTARDAVIAVQAQTGLRIYENPIRKGYKIEVSTIVTYGNSHRSRFDQQKQDVTETPYLISVGQSSTKPTWVHPRIARVILLDNDGEYQALAAVLFEMMEKGELVHNETKTQRYFRYLAERGRLYLFSKSITHFRVFEETIQLQLMLIAEGVEMDEKTMTDGSIGGRWGKIYREKIIEDGKTLEQLYGKPIQIWTEIVPSDWPQAKAGPQKVKAYPRETYSYFMDWFTNIYLLENLLIYLKDRNKVQKENFKRIEKSVKRLALQYQKLLQIELKTS